MFPYLAIHVGKPHYWSVLTHPFVFTGAGGQAIWLLFSLLWLHNFGRQIESREGGRALLAVFFAGAVLHGVLAWALFAALVKSGTWFGPFLAISFVTIYAAGANPRAQVSIMGLVTISMKVLAMGIAVLDVLYVGTSFPIIGLAVCCPLALAWFWGGKGTRLPQRPSKEAKKKNAEFDEFMGKVRKREQDRDEQERLRKLFEGSLSDDKDPEP